MTPTILFTHGIQYVYEVRGSSVFVLPNAERRTPNLLARCKYLLRQVAGQYHRDDETIDGLVNDVDIMTTVLACARARAYANPGTLNDALARSFAANYPTPAGRAQYIGASPLRLHAMTTHMLVNLDTETSGSASVHAAQTSIFIYHEHLRILAALCLAANSNEVLLPNGHARAKPAELINEHELRARVATQSTNF